MRKTLMLFLLLTACLCACHDSEKQLKEKETVHSKPKKQPILDPNEGEDQEKVMELDSDGKYNVIHCENKKFIIKIDRLNDGHLRYIAWSKPNTITDKPDIVLNDGIIEKQGTAGGYHYIFNNQDWTYTVEENLMGESAESIGVFLKLQQNGEEKLYTKMTNLTIEKNYDRAAYVTADLMGDWWTPHYAVRTVQFYDDDEFLFDHGDGVKLNGQFELTGKVVKLSFDNGTVKNLKLGGGKEGTGLILTGDGENFVKRRSE